MTGLEAYDSLKAATANLPCGSSFAVHTLDSLDLGKLTVSDLKARSYDQAIAERVSADLLNGSLDELGRSMGLALKKDPKADRLQAAA